MPMATCVDEREAGTAGTRGGTSRVPAAAVSRWACSLASVSETACTAGAPVAVERTGAIERIIAARHAAVPAMVTGARTRISTEQV